MPRLKVDGIDNNMSLEEIEYDINQRNFIEEDNGNLYCSVDHVYTNKKNKMKTAIIKVNSTIYSLIRSRKNKIYVGYQSCKVFDDINMKPCYNCARIGHSRKKCKNKATCLRCSGEHLTKDCDGKANTKCANYVYRNERFEEKRNTEHVATDTEKCEYIKNVIQRKIRNTDYPVMPFIPKFLGYNHNLPYQPKENSDNVIKSRDLHTQQMTLRQAKTRRKKSQTNERQNDDYRIRHYRNRRADLAGC